MASRVRVCMCGRTPAVMYNTTNDNNNNENSKTRLWCPNYHVYRMIDDGKLFRPLILTVDLYIFSKKKEKRHKYYVCIRFHTFPCRTKNMSLYALLYEYQNTETGDRLSKRYSFSFHDSYEKFTALCSVAGPHRFSIFLVLQSSKIGQH